MPPAAVTESRQRLQLPAWWWGECVGTFLLVFFGCGSVASAVLTGATAGVFQVAIVWGLGIALAAGLFAALFGDALFTGQWLFIGATETDKGLPLSSVLVFDIGVYLVVFGSILTLVFAMEEEI